MSTKVIFIFEHHPPPLFPPHSTHHHSPPHTHTHLPLPTTHHIHPSPTQDAAFSRNYCLIFFPPGRLRKNNIFFEYFVGLKFEEKSRNIAFAFWVLT
jgi:hypothetical protein